MKACNFFALPIQKILWYQSETMTTCIGLTGRHDCHRALFLFVGIQGQSAYKLGYQWDNSPGQRLQTIFFKVVLYLYLFQHIDADKETKSKSYQTIVSQCVVVQYQILPAKRYCNYKLKVIERISLQLHHQSSPIHLVVGHFHFTPHLTLYLGPEI